MSGPRSRRRIPGRGALGPLSAWVGVAIGVALVGACRPPEQTAPPVPLQVVATSASELNLNEGGTQPLNLTLYELRADVDLDALTERDLKDFLAAEAEEEPFGEAQIRAYQETIYHDWQEVWDYELNPETTYVVTVGLYRRPLADAWYQVYRVPKEAYATQVAEHERKARRWRWIPWRRDPPPPPAPCLYLSLEDYELRGGDFPPANVDVSALEIRCAPVATLATSAKKRKRETRDERRSRRAPPPQAPPSATSSANGPKPPSAPNPSAPKPPLP